MLFTLAQSGGGGQLHNYLHLIVVIIALSAGAIGAVLKKLAEQRAIRNQKLARERQRETMLRTGRLDEGHQPAPQQAFEAQMAPPPPLPNIVPEDEARRRLQELAQRRRAELAEMARRAQAGTPVPPPPPPTAIPNRQPPFAPPSRPQHTQPPVLSQRSEEDLRRARNQAAKQRAAQEKAARKAAAQAERQREQELRRRQQREREEAQREADEVPHMPRTMPGAVPGVAPTGQARPGTRTTLGAGSAEEWRRAFITAELLKPPLALREDDRQM